MSETLAEATGMIVGAWGSAEKVWRHGRRCALIPQQTITAVLEVLDGARTAPGLDREERTALLDALSYYAQCDYGCGEKRPLDDRERDHVATIERVVEKLAKAT